MGIKLIMLDLDGTLLTGDKQISKRNMAALEAAVKRGVYIVPSTGRFYMGMPQNVRALPFVRYVVTVNGAEIYDATEDKALYRAEIPAEQADDLFAYMDDYPVIYDCFQEGWGWMDRRFYERIDEFITLPVTNQMVKETRTPIDDFRKVMLARGKSMQKIQMFFKDMNLRAQVMQTMAVQFPSLLISSSITNNIEINSSAANKGAALRFLCEYLNIDVMETMAFGDGLNDLSMLQAAGIGVAMANAEDEVKAYANYLTGSNDDDGVAAAIEKYALSQ